MTEAVVMIQLRLSDSPFHIRNPINVVSAASIIVPVSTEHSGVPHHVYCGVVIA